MAAGKYSFIIEQGSTYQSELTDYSAKMQIRPSPGSTTLYLTLSSSLGPDGSGLNLNGLNGTTPKTSGSIGIIISAYSSSLLTFDQAVYDLELYSGSFVTRVIEGRVQLSKEVTTNG
jgi:hypothetical protein